MIICKMLYVVWRCTAPAGRTAVIAHTPLVMLSDSCNHRNRKTSARKALLAIVLLIQVNYLAIGYSLGLIKDN